MGVALLLHALAAVIWVGGMFFAWVCLRPETAHLEPAARLALWSGVLRRFFAWVWACIAVLLGTGFWMAFALPGGLKGAGLHVHLMLGIGVAMMLLAAHVYFAPLRRLRAAVAEARWTDAGHNLVQIRRFIAVNLALGLAVVAIGAGGRYLLR